MRKVSDGGKRDDYLTMQDEEPTLPRNVEVRRRALIDIRFSLPVYIPKWAFLPIKISFYYAAAPFVDFFPLDKWHEVDFVQHPCGMSMMSG